MFEPQHTTDPSVRNPHECTPPADTDENGPPGGLALPSSSFPQHAAEPSGRTPHACSTPTDTEENAPFGADACPKWLAPQHTTEPSARNPQECRTPADTEEKVPPGAVARQSLLKPQHTIEPSVRTPHECTPPADTAENEPSGAEACPKWLAPQHTNDPSTRTPHECAAPADTTEYPAEPLCAPAAANSEPLTNIPSGESTPPTPPSVTDSGDVSGPWTSHPEPKPSVPPGSARDGPPINTATKTPTSTCFIVSPTKQWPESYRFAIFRPWSLQVVNRARGVIGDKGRAPLKLSLRG